MSEKNDDYDLGREIERSWLFRGEYDKVFDTRAMAYAVFGGILVVSIVLSILLKALGIK